jgi:hypothetical protein
MPPKGLGCIGLRDICLFNQDLLARQAGRRLQFPNSLCARRLKAKYYQRGELIDTGFSSDVSPTWRNIKH